MPIEKIELENVEADFLPAEQQRAGPAGHDGSFEPIKGVGVWACQCGRTDPA
jgi:hypothetical protein